MMVEIEEGNMYDHIFARSFSKNEQKRFGNCALVICIFVAFTLCTLFRPNFHLSILNLEVSSTHSSLDIVILGTSQPMKQQVGSKDGKTMMIGAPPRVNLTNTTDLLTPTFEESREPENTIVDCNFSEALSDYCKIKGSIRIEGRSSTIYTSSKAGNKSWAIRPYPRKGTDAMKSVKEWTIKPSPKYPDDYCNNTNTHAHPAILFSMAGFSGNYFHAFSDIIIPLFTNSRIFDGKVHLLATNYQAWWVTKFQVLLNQLSDHQVVDIDRDHDQPPHCYQNALIGLNRSSHKELGGIIDDSSSSSSSSGSITDFRDFLRSAYSLERQEAIKLITNSSSNYNQPPPPRPRLMIISRKATRRLTNEASIVRMAQKIGYEVVVANITHNTNLSSFAGVVNSCDVLMGVHGAGLTNMVFLPDNAVVLQVVPLGGIEGFAKIDFGDPSKEMNLRYLKYSITPKESSLATQYAPDHVVLTNPMVIHRQGWDAIRTTYLVQQNVKLHVPRFRSTLLRALKLLRN